jgi:uncharacterized protein YkwD
MFTRRLIGAILAAATVASLATPVTAQQISPEAQSAAAYSTPTALSLANESLVIVNALRAQAGLGPVGYNWSRQQANNDQACWMVRNDRIMHGTIAGTPGHSAAANEAGLRSNVAVSSAVLTNANHFHNLWATGPYHMIGIIRPNLRSVAYGHCVFNEGTWRSGGNLDILSDLGPAPSPAPLVLWPADRSTTHLTRFVTESPNPLDNCPSFGGTGGLPVIAMLPNIPSRNVSATMSGPQGNVDTCVITQHNDVSALGRQILAGNNVVVVIPRTPLSEGTWTVNLNNGGQWINWSFGVNISGLGAGPGASPAPTPTPPAPTPTPTPPAPAPSQGTPPGPIRPAEPARLQPIDPCRLADTRTNGVGRLNPGATISVPVAGQCGVPGNASSVHITVTSTNQHRDGFLTAWPSGRPRPNVSNVNTSLGDVRANSSIVRIGDDGAINVYAEGGGNVIVDVTAAFVPSGATSAGRFVPVNPVRMVDTRPNKPAAGATVRVPLPPSVPADASAVVLNVTTTGTIGHGFFTAHAFGTPRPNASMLNVDAPNQTRAASVIVPVSAQGVAVYTSTGDHVIADVTGYFTGNSAPSSSSGRFIADDPARIVDTRTGWGRQPTDSTRNVMTGVTGSSIATNLTIVNPSSIGLLTKFAGGPRPGVSSVNTSANTVAANQSVTGMSNNTFNIYAAADTHVIVDRFGWFTD